MKKFFNKVFLFIFFTILVISFCFLYLSRDENKSNIKITYAGVGEPLSNYAWNNEMGWLSFSGVVNTSITYSVNVNREGEFSGYAWNEKVGWVSFGKNASSTGAPPDNYAFTSNCMNTTTCSSATNCIACLNLDNKNIYGWAKIIKYENDDGWISLRGTTASSTYGLYAESTDEIRGFAWNANETRNGIGWISFNCLESITSSCTTSSYKVEIPNFPPRALDLTASNWSFLNACQGGARNAFLTWSFDDLEDGSSQTAYQVIVDTVNHTETELNNLSDGAGTATPLKTSFASSSAISFNPTNNTHRNIALQYDTAYYWWVKLWDSQNSSSTWIQYNSLLDTDNDDGNNLTFTTYKHEFPDVSFSWLPTKPVLGQETNFISSTTIYAATTTADYLWTITPDNSYHFSASTSPITSPTSTNIYVFFMNALINNVSLRVTDVDGYYCETSDSTQNVVPMPLFKEIKAE